MADYDDAVNSGLVGRPPGLTVPFVQLPYEGSGARAPRIYYGAGSPEAVVTGRLGDLYMQDDGGLVWVKGSGADTNTGWLNLRPTSSVITFADGDTTPSLAAAVTSSPIIIAKTNNSAPTSITGFDGRSGATATPGLMFLLATDAQTTLVDGATLILNASANYVMGIGDTIILGQILIGTGWHEFGRSEN